MRGERGWKKARGERGWKVRGERVEEDERRVGGEDEGGRR